MGKCNIIIVGAGPAGLSAAISATKAGLNCIVLEKGSLADSIRRYPVGMQFFSTADNISIGNIPFAIAGTKPSRAEALNYYRKVADYFNIEIRCYEEVVDIKNWGDYMVQTTQRKYKASKVILATGYFSQPNPIEIQGVNQPKVSRYYDEPFAHVGRKVLVVGAGNSAIEAALDLHRHGAIVTIMHRSPQLKHGVKYWLKPDIENRVTEGSIRQLAQCNLTSISPRHNTVSYHGPNGDSNLVADFVYILVGYRPETTLYHKAGVNFNPQTLIPEFDPATFQTNQPGLYVCGTVVAGIFTEKIFIENGRLHGDAIINHILGHQNQKPLPTINPDEH